MQEFVAELDALTDSNAKLTEDLTATVIAHKESQALQLSKITRAAVLYEFCRDPDPAFKKACFWILKCDKS